MPLGRLWIGSLIALASAMASYVAFEKGPGFVDSILHPPQPEEYKKFVPPPSAPPPRPYVFEVESPATAPVAPLPPVTIPGAALPPPRKSK